MRPTAQSTSPSGKAPPPQGRAKNAGGGWLSRYARTKKLEFFFRDIPHQARILDVGCAEGWVEEWALTHGWTNITGIDLQPPADIVGDIRCWRDLDLEPHSFDYIIAFEVIEHGDFALALHQLLRTDGRLIVTTPVPSRDWVCKLLERVGVLQVRSGPHDHLTDIRAYPYFKVVSRRIRGLISQWGILAPTGE